MVTMSRYAEFVKIYRKKNEFPTQPVKSRLCVDLLSITACEECSEDETKITVGMHSYVVKMSYNEVNALIKCANNMFR